MTKAKLFYHIAAKKIRKFQKHAGERAVCCRARALSPGKRRRTSIARANARIHRRLHLPHANVGIARLATRFRA
jgi:hypothetical protein